MLAVSSCGGVIRDSSGNPIQGVETTVTWGDGTTQRVKDINYSNGDPTGPLGEYSFPIISDTIFGQKNSQGIIKLEFVKSGLQTLSIPTDGSPGNPAKCPGSVTMQGEAQPTDEGYVCNTDSGCLFVTSSPPKYTGSNAKSSCENDCKQLIYDQKTGSCQFPDPNSKYHSQIEECAKKGNVPTIPPTSSSEQEANPYCVTENELKSVTADCGKEKITEKISCKNLKDESGFNCPDLKQSFCKSPDGIKCAELPAAPPPCSEFVALLDNGKTGDVIPTGDLRYVDPAFPKQCAKVDTGLGISIDPTPEGFIKSLFGILLSTSGGIALLLIIVSGYRLIASQGNPEKVQAAKETLTSAIIGLVFIIFSLSILQLIGVDILHIPGFSR